MTTFSLVRRKGEDAGHVVAVGRLFLLGEVPDYVGSEPKN